MTVGIRKFWKALFPSSPPPTPSFRNWRWSRSDKNLIFQSVGLVLGSRRSSTVGNGNPLQDSCLENPMDRGAWQAMVHGGRKESDRTECLNRQADKRCDEESFDVKKQSMKFRVTQQELLPQGKNSKERFFFFEAFSALWELNWLGVN